MHFKFGVAFLSLQSQRLPNTLHVHDCQKFYFGYRNGYRKLCFIYIVHVYLFPEIEEEEEEVGPYDSEPVEQRQVSQTEEGEPGLKAWPPMSNTQGTSQNRGQCSVPISRCYR